MCENGDKNSPPLKYNFLILFIHLKVAKSLFSPCHTPRVSNFNNEKKVISITYMTTVDAFE